MPQTRLPPNTVILHQMGRAKHTPSLSPFAMKLETYLRMSEISYKSVHTRKKSSKGETPWIEFNEDSSVPYAFSVDILKKKCDKDLNANLSDEQKCVGKAFQRLMEDSLYWTLLYARWIDKDYSNSMRDSFPNGFMMDINLWRERGQIEKSLQCQGLGKHSADDIYLVALSDIRAVSQYLGKNQYFFGDEPSDIDATIFGFMAAFAYELPGSPQERLIKGDCKNILAYLARMKERYWPDWKKCIMGNKTIDDFPAVPKTDPTLLISDDESSSSSSSQSSSARSSKSSKDDATTEDANADAAPTANATGTQSDANDATATQELTPEQKIKGGMAALEREKEIMDEKVQEKKDEIAGEIEKKVEDAKAGDTSEDSRPVENADETKPEENAEETKPEEKTEDTTDETKAE